MFLAPRQRKTTVFTRFWASASKNHSIYSVLWPGPSKNTGIYAVSCMLSEAFFGCQRHKNIVNYTIFTRGQYQKIMKNWPKTDQKTPNKDLQNASANFTLFSPTPNPQKRENPSRLKDFRGGSAAPARPRVAKAMLSNHHRTASPDLSAYARQPARGPTMLAHLVAICWPMLAYVGLSCGQRGPILWLCWPMLASGWPMWSQKIRKMGTAKKRCKTQDILMVGGLSWGYVGPSWGYGGLSWGQCGPILRLCWPILGLCCPILGLCWSLLGAMLAHLGAMLAHLEAYVGPCWPILNHKIRKSAKNGKSTKHRKTRGFLAGGEVGGRGRGPSLLRRGENCRTAMPRPGGPWPDLWGLRLTAGRRQKQTRQPELVLWLLLLLLLLVLLLLWWWWLLLLLWLLLLSLSSVFLVVVCCRCCVLLLLLRWSSLFFWCGVTDALGVVLASPCVRRGPGLRASRQHPSSEGGWQPGCTWRTPKSGEPSCTLSLRKREKQASTLATFVVTRGRCEPISSSGPSYCLLSLNPSQWSSI